MNAELFFEWSIVILFLGFLFYAAIVIGNEKNTYLQEADKTAFHKIEIPIPNWWGLTKKEANYLRYERTDTRYDWFATYEYLSSKLPVPELIIEKLQSEKIKMDPEAVIEERSAHLFRNEELLSQIYQMSRIEGMATHDEQDRLYYDIVILKLEGDLDNYYQFISRSSVLNGAIEGPFFEEALVHASYLKDF